MLYCTGIKWTAETSVLQKKHQFIPVCSITTILMTHIPNNTTNFNADISTVLAAWNEAAQRLEQTHETLHAEVRRLNDVIAEKDKELERKNRLADLGLMGSHIAHEIRNALVPVTLYISLLKRKINSSSGCDKIFDCIQNSFFDLETTVNDLLHFATDKQPICECIQAEAFIETVCESVFPQLDAQNIDTFIDVATECEIYADPEMLKRIILNLLLNAMDAMPKGGQLNVSACENNGFMEIRVTDTGPGFSPDAIKRATEPFYSTKSTGTGLGLAIVLRIVESHNGRLKISNNSDCGATITIILQIGKDECCHKSTE